MKSKHYFIIPSVLSGADIDRIIKDAEHYQHHDEDGHQAPKTANLPWVAELVWGAVKDIKGAHSVDPNMKLYRLLPGDCVAGHVDDDFPGPDNSIALWSIVLYLNKNYTGGSTIFDGAVEAKNVPVGGGLLFHHKVWHESPPVLSGVRYVLKTDLFICQTMKTIPNPTDRVLICTIDEPGTVLKIRKDARGVELVDLILDSGDRFVARLSELETLSEQPTL